MLKDFRQFILRGNVVDLAVGVVMGAAFKGVIDSLVKDILTPLLGVFGSPNFADLTQDIGESVMTYGVFLNTVLSFLLIGFAVFFFVVKPINRLMDRRKTQPEVESTTRECPHCISSIPVAASRCAFCTQAVEAAI